MDRSKVIFGNPVSDNVVRKAEKSKQKYLKKFGDDSNVNYALKAVNNPVLTPFWNVKNIEIGNLDSGINPDAEMAPNAPINPEKGIVVGNIRMGFGHYRISMAIASAAHSMGYQPYWFDLNAYENTTGGKVIGHLNQLYSMGSRWSQKYRLFNKFYWEPLNSEGFRKLAYNAADQKISELMTPVYRNIPKEMPFIATHVWPAQAAVHAGIKRVVNVIPDNWPMALHLAEGSIHTVQSFSSYLGYKTLNGMEGKQVLKAMPEDSIYEVGHYIDHELVSNLEEDCRKRLDRIENNKSKRILLTIGGAGAQRDLFAMLISALLPKVQAQEVTLLINVGDYKNVWEGLVADIPELGKLAVCHFDQWEETKTFANSLIEGDAEGIHVFYHKDIFAAVYATNLLMRSTDLMVTKPSELSFYPVPKLMIKRVGGHEAWGAVRAAEIGDGTIECSSTDQALQMMSMILNEKAVMRQFSEHILKANQIGLYDGAYKAVALAVGQVWQRD